MTEQLLNAKQVARMLGYSPRYFGEKFIFRPEVKFPSAIRAAGTGSRMWKESEVLAWIERNREAA